MEPLQQIIQHGCSCQLVENDPRKQEVQQHWISLFKSSLLGVHSNWLDLVETFNVLHSAARSLCWKCKKILQKHKYFNALLIIFEWYAYVKPSIQDTPIAMLCRTLPLKALYFNTGQFYNEYVNRSGYELAKVYGELHWFPTAHRTQQWFLLHLAQLM